MEDRGGVEHGDYTRLLYTASYIPSMNGHYTELLYTVSIHGDYVRWLLEQDEPRLLQEGSSVSARSAPDTGSPVWWNMPLR